MSVSKSVLLRPLPQLLSNMDPDADPVMLGDIIKDELVAAGVEVIDKDVAYHYIVRDMAICPT